MFRTALSSERSGFTGQAGRGKSREAVQVPLRIQGDGPRGAAHHRIVGLRRKRHHDALQVKLQTCKKTEPFPAPGPSRCDGGGAYDWERRAQNLARRAAPLAGTWTGRCWPSSRATPRPRQTWAARSWPASTTSSPCSSSPTRTDRPPARRRVRVAGGPAGSRPAHANPPASRGCQESDLAKKSESERCVKCMRVHLHMDRSIQV